MLDISKLTECPICGNRLNCYDGNSHFVTRFYLGLFFEKIYIYFDHIDQNKYKISISSITYSIMELNEVKLDSLEHAYILANKIVENMIFS